MCSFSINVLSNLSSQDKDLSWRQGQLVLFPCLHGKIVHLFPMLIAINIIAYSQIPTTGVYQEFIGMLIFQEFFLFHNLWKWWFAFGALRAQCPVCSALPGQFQGQSHSIAPLRIWAEQCLDRVGRPKGREVFTYKHEDLIMQGLGV